MFGVKEFGRKEKSIFEPSSGGIGTKLNNPKARFIITIIEVMGGVVKTTIRSNLQTEYIIPLIINNIIGAI